MYMENSQNLIAIADEDLETVAGGAPSLFSLLGLDLGNISVLSSTTETNTNTGKGGLFGNGLLGGALIPGVL
jgi:hypothetical protein